MAKCLAVLPTSFDSEHIGVSEASVVMKMFLAQLFNMIDSKKQGSFGFRELMLFGNSYVRQSVPSAMVDSVFKLYDMDGDGELDPVEVRTMVVVSC